MPYQNFMVDDFGPLKSLFVSNSYISRRFKDELEREIAIEVPLVHPKQSITYISLYMTNFALAYRITGEKRYLDAALAWMRAVSNYPGWGNDKNIDVDLSASWNLWGLSLAFDWLYEEFSEEDRELFTNAIEHHCDIFLDFVDSHLGHGWSTEYWQNHNWINMTGIASAGYVMNRRGLDGHRAIEMTEANFAKVYEELAEDGSNYEGCSYWRYGGMWLFMYAWISRSEGYRDFFKTSGYLQNTFYYRLYQSSSDLSRQLNFGDTHDLYSSHPACVYFMYAREYRDGHAQKLGHKVVTEFLADEWSKSKVHPGILPEAGLEFIFFDPTVEEKDFTDLPLHREFADLGLVSIRSSWEKDAMCFSFKCGYPGGKKQWTHGWPINRKNGWQCMSVSHHHPDNLCYQLVKGERYFVADDGYNRVSKAFNHGNLLVDGCFTDAEGVSDIYRISAEQRIAKDSSFRPDEEYYGTLSPLCISREGYSAEGRSEKIYPLELGVERASRYFFTDGRSFVFFLSVLRTEEPRKLSLVTNTFERPIRKGIGDYEYPETGVTYKVVSDCHIEDTFSVHVIESIMTPQEPDLKCRVDQQSLDLSTSKKEKSCCFAELVSYDGGELAIEKDRVVLEIAGKRYEFSIPKMDEGVKGAVL